MKPIFDLAGDPIPENKFCRGRPQHAPTDEMRRKIKRLIVFGMTVETLSLRLKLSQPTLRRYYFEAIREGRRLRAELEK